MQLLSSSAVRQAAKIDRNTAPPTNSLLPSVSSGAAPSFVALPGEQSEPASIGTPVPGANSPRTDDARAGGRSVNGQEVAASIDDGGGRIFDALVIHAHDDDLMLRGAAALLAESGLRVVYLTGLNRSLFTRLARVSRSLLVAVEREQTAVNAELAWKLGYFEAQRNRIANLPILPKGDVTERFRCKGFLCEYPYAALGLAVAARAYTFWIVPPDGGPKQAENFEYWMGDVPLGRGRQGTV